MYVWRGRVKKPSGCGCLKQGQVNLQLKVVVSHEAVRSRRIQPQFLSNFITEGGLLNCTLYLLLEFNVLQLVLYLTKLHCVPFGKIVYRTQCINNYFIPLFETFQAEQTLWITAAVSNVLSKAQQLYIVQCVYERVQCRLHCTAVATVAFHQQVRNSSVRSL